MRRLLLIALLALLPGLVWAQPPQPLPPPRTTPAEVAAAMLPCVEGVGPTAPLMGAGLDFATIAISEGRTIGLTRYAQAPRPDAYWFQVPDDPIQPPLTLDFYDSPNPLIGGISRQGYWTITECFQAVYPPR